MPCLLIMNKKLAVCLIGALCIATLSFSLEALGKAFMETSVGKGTVSISCSSEEDVLRIDYSSDKKECHLLLTSTQRIGLLIQVAGSQITYSLNFLEEDETWPTDDTLEEEEYTSKTIFKASGWTVIIVQRAE